MKLQLWLAVWALVCATIVALGFIVNEPLLMVVLVAAPLALASILVCRRLDPERDLRLTELFLIAVSVRWLAATVIQYLIYPSRPYLFAVDEGGYAAWGVELSRHLSSPLPNATFSLKQPGIIWLTGLCYYLVGPVILLPKLINGIFGAWAAVFTARIAAHATSDEASRRAGLMAALFPSLVLWGSVLLKDMHTLLGALMCLFGATRLLERGQARNLVLIAAGLGLVISNRAYQGLFVAVGMLAAYFAKRNPSKGKLRSWIMTAVLLSVLVGMLSGVFSEWITPAGDQEGLSERVNVIRRGYTDADSALDVTGYDTSTPLGMLAWLPIGVAAMYLAPIPFTGSSTISSATTPEMLIWYMLLPAIIRGLGTAYRSGALRRIAGPVAYVVVASVGWATVITNVGSLYRYRAQTLVFLLILLAIDQVRRKNEKEERKRAAESRLKLLSAQPARRQDRLEQPLVEPGVAGRS
ncbi:MAG: glycosyltransferase family 39 protein [Polyangiaceae bacterium]